MVVAAEALMAQPRARGSSYVVASPLTGREETLKRGVDFGVIAGTKRPSLYKSGAEKVIMAYGLMCRYDIESSMARSTEYFITSVASLFASFLSP